MKTHALTSRIALGLVLGGVGGSALAETALQATGGWGYLHRLYRKGAESTIDALIRQAVASGAAPPPHEDYELSARCSYYEDQVWGVYQSAHLPYRRRMMWLDASTGGQFFQTYSDGVLLDREAFYWIPHNRIYDCTGSGEAAAVYDYHIRASVRFQLQHHVMRADLDHAVPSHPVVYHFVERTLPRDCTSTDLPLEVDERGYATLSRGGRYEVSPWLPTVDVLECRLWYDDK